MEYGFAPRVPTNRRTMQIRIFRDADTDALEHAVNQWLAERPDREIAEVRQSAAHNETGRLGELVISVWYIEG